MDSTYRYSVLHLEWLYLYVKSIFEGKNLVRD